MMAGTPWDAVLNLIQGQKLTDLLVVGYLNRDERMPCFEPMFDRVYVQVEEGLLEIASIDQGDQLHIRLADEIRHDELSSTDDAIVPGVVRLSKMYFGEFQAIRCLSTTVYLDERSNNADGIVKGLELGLEGGHTLSFDPLWSFGIKLSSEPYLDSLLRWHPPPEGEMPNMARWQSSLPS